MLKEFKDFALKGNAVEMAIGIIIGAAFGTIVKSLVTDILMPPLGLALGGFDFTNLFFTLKEGTAPAPYATLEAAKQAGAVTINIGLFLNAVIGFLLVAIALFFVVRALNAARKKEDPASAARPCPECTLSISTEAKRCPYCTSKVTPLAQS